MKVSSYNANIIKIKVFPLLDIDDLNQVCPSIISKLINRNNFDKLLACGLIVPALSTQQNFDNKYMK